MSPSAHSAGHNVKVQFMDETAVKLPQKDKLDQALHLISSPLLLKYINVQPPTGLTGFDLMCLAVMQHIPQYLLMYPLKRGDGIDLSVCIRHRRGHLRRFSSRTSRRRLLCFTELCDCSRGPVAVAESVVSYRGGEMADF